jgi:hypothetical protein
MRQQEQDEIMIKNLRNLREGELTRKSTEFELVQNLLITYGFSLFILSFN